MWARRFGVGLAVATFLSATHVAVPEPAHRAEIRYLLVLPLGYGHLLGAAWSLRRRISLRPGAEISLLGLGFAAAAVVTLFALYAAAMGSRAEWVLPGPTGTDLYRLRSNSAALVY